MCDVILSFNAYETFKPRKGIFWNLFPNPRANFVIFLTFKTTERSDYFLERSDRKMERSDYGTK